MSFNKITNNFSECWYTNLKKFKKTPLISKLVMILIIILIALIIINHLVPQKEGFTQASKFIVKKNDDIYDQFYCSLYDELVYNKNKNNFELDIINNLLLKNRKNTILDIGSGTGHHVNTLHNNGNTVIGIDKSQAMIKYASTKYPKADFRKVDALNTMTFPRGYFTHILCLYFTIYYIEDKQRFLQNCFSWLMPGGFLVLHLVNRNMFDPILPAADPLVLISSQKYVKNRITTSAIKFKDFKYKARFSLDNKNNLGTFTEDFKDDTTKKVRQNEHILYMPPQKTIIDIAKNIGFIVYGQVSMVECEYEYQYLYILQKPG
jgi:SAM-dependent methyltransferase